MIDANEQALNNYLSEQSRQEKALERFEEKIADDVQEILEKINELQALAQDYEGYNFENDLNIILGDLIWKHLQVN